MPDRPERAASDVQHYLGVVLREIRIEKRTTQRKIGLKVDPPDGVADSTVGNWEHGETWPQNPRRTFETYAEIDGTTQLAIWERVIERWRAGEAGSSEAVADAFDPGPSSSPGEQPGTDDANENPPEAA